MKLLEIKNLTTEFKTGQGIVKAVRNVNYSLEKGEILGIVGESGSGKSVGMLSLMGLLADNGRIVSGSIIFDGEEISPISEKYKNNKKAYEKSRNTKSGKENRPVSVPVFRWYETTNYHSDCTFMQS